MGIQGSPDKDQDPLRSFRGKPKASHGRRSKRPNARLLGKEGWELVSVQGISLQDGGMFTVAYLKEQKRNRVEG